MQISKLTILSMLLATLSMLMLGACSDAIDPVVQDGVESAGGKFLSISITAGALQNADAPKASRVVRPNLEVAQVLQPKKVQAHRLMEVKKATDKKKVMRMSLLWNV